MQTLSMEQIKQLQTFPLHIHWDGAISEEYIFNAAEKKSEKLFLPDFDVNGQAIIYKNENDKLIKNPSELKYFWNNLLIKYSMIDVFNSVTNFMQTKEDLISAAVSHCEYLKSQNTPYAETRFAPFYHTKKELSMDQVVGYAIEGFEKGKEQTGVDVRLILSISREVDSDIGVDIAKLAVKYNTSNPQMILGIDLACMEIGNPPEKHYDAFELTFDTPLKRTIHAGEMCSEQLNLDNIRTAVYMLRANAISHAIPLYKDEDLIQTFVWRDIRLESNPLCNQFFFGKKIEDLHLDELVNKGVLVTINPDDPAMIPNGDVANNLYELNKLYGLEFVNKVIRNSIKSAWGLNEVEKNNYFKEHNELFKKLV